MHEFKKLCLTSHWESRALDSSLEGFGTSEQLLTHSSYWLPVVTKGDEFMQRAWRNPDRLRTEDAAKSEPCAELLKNVLKNVP